ncbi:acyltransferase [Roseateles sp. L2-2]|uniref:LpxL/LpxP family acyltransferase n=1 Tax=Roseateles TaxID=93681 RepID=UPI003D362C72
MSDPHGTAASGGPGEPREPRHWAQFGETTFVAGIWLLYALHRVAGRWLFRSAMFPVVLVHWLSRPALRRDSLDYLRRVHAQTGRAAPTWRDSVAHVALFADTMLDKLLAMAGRYPAERVSVDGKDEVLAHLRTGQGVVLATAHIGCLELCRALAGRMPGLRLNVLVHTRHAQSFNRILDRLQGADAIADGASVRLIEVTGIDPALAMQLAERIAAGECIVIAGDRVPVNSGRTLTLPFLGAPARFPIGPYLIAGLLKCPLFFMGCVHEGRGYALRFERLADRIALPRGDREGAMTAPALAYVDALTRCLRRSPHDWFNFFPFWNAPDVES